LRQLLNLSLLQEAIDLKSRDLFFQAITSSKSDRFKKPRPDFLNLSLPEELNNFSSTSKKTPENLDYLRQLR